MWASLVAQLQCRRPWFDTRVGKIPWQRDRLPTPVFMESTGLPSRPDGKESACKEEDLGLIPGLERSPGGGHGNLSVVLLLGESPWIEELGRLESMGLQRVGHN